MTPYPTRLFIWLLLLISSTITVAGQRVTTTNRNGQTIVQLITTDADGDPSTRTLTTLTSSRASSRSSSSSTSLSAARSTNTSTSAVLRTATASVPPGAIKEYGSYQSSVSADVAARSASAASAYFATATDFGIRTSGGVGKLCLSQATRVGAGLTGMAIVLFVV